MLKLWSALSWLFTYCLTLVRHRVFLSKEKEKVFRVWKWQVYLFSSTGLWSCRAAVKFPFPRVHTPLLRMSSSHFHTSILSSRACLAHRKGFSVKAQVWTLARLFWSPRDGFLHRVCGFRSSSSTLKAQGGPQRPWKPEPLCWWLLVSAKPESGKTAFTNPGAHSDPHSCPKSSGFDGALLASKADEAGFRKGERRRRWGGVQSGQRVALTGADARVGFFLSLLVKWSCTFSSYLFSVLEAELKSTPTYSSGTVLFFPSPGSLVLSWALQLVCLLSSLTSLMQVTPD